jgi:D-amino-acid dehydrogenase
MTETVDVAIVGAGVIGLTIALTLAAEGREVMLIDPAAPGSGASFGNAGTIADYAVQPVGTPDVLRNLPSLLFDRNSPLSIRRAALPSLAPWLLKFAHQSLPDAARRNAQAIAALMAGAAPAWSDLLVQVGATPYMKQRGCLYLYESKSGFEAAKADLAFRKTLGVAVEMVDPATLATMEPGLPIMDGGAAFFPQAVFLTDPGAVMAKIAQSILAMGVQHRKAKVTRLQRGPSGVHLTGTGLAVTAHQVVIAAGAHSRVLAAMAGDRIPLETERGYHLEWDGQGERVSRPSCPTSRGFYLCPMAGRLRVAGTVELGGVNAPLSRHRVDKLAAGARAIFPDLGKPDREWLGFRPSLPDSIPVIGPSRGGSDVVLAFGHGHVGVTLAPVTARIVADALGGRTPQAAASMASPLRF